MAISAPTSIGASAADAGGGTSGILDPTAAVPSGGLIILVVSLSLGGNAASGVTVTNAGNAVTWTKIAGKQGTVDTDRYISIWQGAAASGLGTGSGSRISVSNGGTVTHNWGISGSYITGHDTTTPLDATAAGSSGTGNSWSSGNLTNSAANCCLIGGSWRDAVTSSTADTGNGWTELHDFQNTVDAITLTSVYQLVSSAATRNAAGTWTASSAEWVSTAVSIREAGSGADGTVTAVPADGLGAFPAPSVAGDPTVDHDQQSRSHSPDSAGHTAASAFTWTHTPVGTPKGIVVAVTQPLGSADEVSAVTYGGVACSRIVSQARTSTEQMRTYLYFLGSGIPTGAQTVSVTSTGTLAKQGHCFSMTTSNGSDTFVDASNSADLGISANPSLTVTHSGTISGWAGYAIHGYGGAAVPNLTASAVRQTGCTLGFGHDPGAATAETYRRNANSPASSSTYGYTTLASDDQVLAALVVRPAVSAGTTVPPAAGTGAFPAPAVTGSGGNATVTAVPADGLGDLPAPAAIADSTVTSPPADATGDVPAPTVSAVNDAAVTAPPADGLGDFPAPAASADSTVTAPPAAGTGDFPASGMDISSTVTTGAGTATGDFPAPTVSGTGDGTVTAVPADGTGDLPAPAVHADASVTAPPADGTGDMPTPAATAGSSVTSPAADGTGDVPAPTVTADASITSPPADGTGDAPDPSIGADATVTAPPAAGLGTFPVPGVTGDVSDPAPDTPTSVELDAHVSSLVLNAHAGAVTLDAHVSSLVLNAHAASVVLGAHQPGTVTLDVHASSLTLDDHRSTLALDP